MRTRGSVVGKVLTYFFLALLALIFLVPVFYVMYNSLLPKRYIGSFVPPSVWSLDNYKELFADFPIMGWYKNTAISTLSVVLGNIVFTPMAGYGLARLRFPGKKVIFVCLMLSMMIPGQLVLLPQYIMMAQMGLVDTLAAIIIPYLSQSMFIFMARQFFYGIPEELEEAARIDGPGPVRHLCAHCAAHFWRAHRHHSDFQFYRHLELLPGSLHLHLHPGEVRAGGGAANGEQRAFPAGKSHSGRRVPLVLPCHHLLHVYPEVLRAGNRHIRHQELNPGPGTGFPALQY